MIGSGPPNRLISAARWLMLVYVAVLPVVRPLDTRLLGIHIFATDLIFAFAFLFWLAASVRRRPWFDLRYLGVLGAYSAAFTLSAVFSTEPQKSVVKLIGVFYLAALSLVIADLCRDRGFLRNLTYAWLVGSSLTILGFLAGLIGFSFGYVTMETNFFLFHSGSLPPGNYPRVMAFFENPNMTANYLNVAVMIVIGACAAGWISKRAWIVILALLMGSALFTISPGAGGIAVSLGLWLAYVTYVSSKRLRRLVLAGSIVIATVVLIATAISPITRDSESSITIPIVERRIEPSVRSLIWKDSIERGLEYPILGRGTGTDAAHVRYQVLSGQKQLLRDAHQAWLNIFGQTGFIGLAAFIAFCWYLFSICRFTIREGADGNAMLIACSCGWVGAFLYQNLFGSFEDARQLWVLIGMLVGTAGSNTGQD